MKAIYVNRTKPNSCHHSSMCMLFACREKSKNLIMPTTKEYMKTKRLFD